MAPRSTTSTSSTTAARAFGIALKRARRAAHLTQAQLAEAAGFSVVYISMLERGARQPQRSTVTLLADALALSSTERATWEEMVQRSAHHATARGRGHDEASPVPIGAFLGAAPSGPLVGREVEVQTIGGALAAVAAGQGRMLLLIGEPGVGKTRLAQEMTILARARGFRLLTGRCYEPQQSLAYAPLIEALTQSVPLIEAAALSPLAERWPEVARLLPDHAARAPAGVDDGAARQRLYYQLTGLLSALAQRQPLALLVDDLHWADGASLEALQHLARHTRDQPVLLVGTTRAVEAARQHPLVDALRDLDRDELVQQLTLRPLAAEETADLIGVTLGGADGALGDASSISPELATRIQARSEGNALFTRQLARALQEQGNLSFTEGKWRLSETAAAAFTPASIRAVIAQRLGRLSAHTQEVLREASVLGQVVAFDELAQLGGRGEQEVEEALEEAGQSGILRAGQRDKYHFNHALTRDTLYAELSARKQRRLHRAAADAIEQLTNPERRAAELEYHLLAAEEGERALPYALLAGDQAESVYAHAEAEGHYRTALTTAQEVGDARTEALALEKLGGAVRRLGRHAESAAICQRALHAYQDLDDQFGELRALAGVLWALGSVGGENLEEAVAQAKAILARIEPAEASTITPALGSALAAVYGNLGWLLWTSGHYTDAQAALRPAVALARAAGDEAELAFAQFHLLIAGGLEPTPEAFEETLALAERSGQTTIVVTSHNMAGGMYWVAGDFARALEHYEQSIVAAERQQDPGHLAWQLSNFAAFLLAYGDWERMRALYARSEAIMREVDRHGETWHSAGISLWPGTFALMDGREADGRRLLEEAMDRIVRVGVVFLLQEPTCLLAEADLLAGLAEQARRRLTTLLDHTHPTPAEDKSRQPLLLLAWAELALGQEEEAEARLHALLADATPLFSVDALRVRGLLATQQERWDEGVTALQEAIERAHSMPCPYAELKALWVYGRLEAARGDAVAATERFTHALAICARLGEGWYRTHIARDLAALARKR
jgi:tetratricopeptide (TPR) repeat protein/transcriptional regulator with XRE-family HTH domain